MRFDPLIYCDDYQRLYKSLFEEVFQNISIGAGSVFEEINLSPQKKKVLFKKELNKKKL